VSDPAEQATTPQVPSPWTPPSAPPFGTPVPQPGYAYPPGYSAPTYAGAPSYAGAPTYAGAPSYATAPAARGRAIGLVALILALVAVVGSSVVGAIAGTSAGLALGPDLVYAPLDYSNDLSVFSPVRGWVLLGEVAFWVGTVLGTWALIQGIIAAVKGRGRATGIAAIVIATIGPLVFFTVTWGALAVGIAAGGATSGP
jgi:hypothetical protein